MLFIKVLIILILIAIFLQDLVTRSVYWLFFPILTLLFITVRFLDRQPLIIIFGTVMINIGFLTVQMLILSAYISLKNRKWINITNLWLGWGDILFLISIAIYLSVLNFIFFYIVSLILILLIWLIWQNFTTNKKIPLAGLQAMIFAVLLANEWWYFPVNLTSDSWILKLINP